MFSLHVVVFALLYFDCNASPAPYATTISEAANTTTPIVDLGYAVHQAVVGVGGLNTILSFGADNGDTG